MEKEVEETHKSVRMFVGGLGESVSNEDLRTLFASLSTVQTLQTIRTKGRSFAYIDFLSDPKSLSKLFSKFNGCLWKGGRLTLGKAKEDYLTRLKREWEQQEALLDAAQSSPVVLREMPTTNTANTHKSNTKHLNIYFPRLRKASVVAETASKSIAELQVGAEESESSKEDEGSAAEKESDDESSKLRNSALDRLEKASEDSLLSQGLKVFDNSVESFASGAWSALGNAWRGSNDFIQRLEKSSSNIGGSPRHDGSGAAGSNASSLLETGKAFTAKGMQVLEYVGKETMDLLISETGIEVEKDKKEGEEESDEDQLSEEVTFDRCFYIYGGPEQLEELEALSSHYALLFNRRKAKLSAEQKSVYDGKLKEVQQIFNLSTEIDRSNADVNKGKTIKRGNEGSSDEMKNLHDSSVGKAAEMAAGFTNALAGLSANDIIQRTTARVESLHSEGVHRLSEMCCFAVSQLLMFGKSIISRANKTEDEADDDKVNLEWPEDVSAKANILRINAQTMIGYVDAVSNSFITGISDVTEAYQAAIKAVTAESHSVVSVQEKASAFSEHLRADQTTAICKIQDGLQFLAHVLISTSMNAAA